MEKFDLLIDEYTKAKLKEEVDEAILKMAKDAFRSSILDEVKGEYEGELRKKIKQELQKEEQLDKVNQAKRFLIESIFLATFIGLMVNQITDMMTFIKCYFDKTCCLTILLILAFVIILIAYIKFSYIDRVTALLNEHFKNKEL